MLGPCPLFLVGKAGFEARKLSVEELYPFYRSAELSTMIPPHSMDQTQTIRFYSLLSIMPIVECVMGGALGTPVALRTRGDPTTERRVAYSIVNAQRGARLMAIAPVRDCGRPLSQASPPRKRPFPRPPVKSVVHSSASLSTNPPLRI